MANNTISNDETSNVSGNGTGGYQAGISDLGNKDNIVNNKISGIGYNMTLPGSVYTQIDSTSSMKLHANNNG